MNLTIGSRGSQLALWQSEWTRSRLLKMSPDGSVEIEVIRTKGDANLSDSFVQIGGKGVFTKEVEDALLSGRTHLSVHSLKDLPTTLPDGLMLTALSPREDVRDALCTRSGKGLSALPEGGLIGTSSLRRQALIRSERPDCEILPLRGNVDTRIKKLDTEDLDAIVLAGAGLKRLGVNHRISELLPPERFIPAPGQGVMAIVSREDDRETADLLAPIDDPDARAAVTAERSALAELGGGCKIPFGAWARIKGGDLVVGGVVAHPERGESIRSQREGRADEAEDLGKYLAEDLLTAGAAAILEEVLG